MSTTTTQAEDLDLDALQADAEGRIADLESARAALALDALTDTAAESELADTVSALTAARAGLEQIELARRERDRRERQAIADAEQAEREKGLAEARKLAPKVKAAAEAIDSTAQAFAEALSEYAARSAELSFALDRAGSRALRPAGSAVAAALVRAMLDADVPRGLIDLHGIPPRPVPMVQSLPSQALGEDS